MASHPGRLDGRQAFSVRVPKAAELVAAELRRQIVRGELAPDDALPNESALMSHYDVSRPTLREALRILESEGLVAVKRGAHGGARVRLPDVAVAARYAATLLQLRDTTLEDLFAARRILEPAAVRMLADKPKRAVLKALQAQHEKELAVVDDPDAFASAATEFHEMLVELAGNRTLSLFCQMVIEIVDRHHHATFAGAPALQKDFAEEGSEQHGRLIEL